MSTIVNSRQKPNNAVQELLEIVLILGSENDNDTNPNYTLVGHHVPPGRSAPTPRPDVLYEWS
jgi:hypothetical protein